MNMRQLRRAQNLTQEDLAERVGLSQSYISRIEKGDKGVTLGTIEDICEALEIELYDLFGDERSQMEEVLIRAFRSLPEERKLGWIDMARQAKVGQS